MIGTLFMPFRLWRQRGRYLAMAAVAGPTALTADAAASNPALTGLVILGALFLFGTFILSRWKALLWTGPIWLLLLMQVQQTDDQTRASATPPVAEVTSPRPIARPWS